MRVNVKVTSTGPEQFVRPTEETWAKLAAIVCSEIDVLYKKATQSPAQIDSQLAPRLTQQEALQLKVYMELFVDIRKQHPDADSDSKLSDEELLEKLS